MTTTTRIGGLLAAATAAALAAVTLSACGSTAAPATGSSHAAPPAATAPALTAEQIAARMHLGHVFGYTATTDTNELLGRPHEYTSKVNWGAATSDDSYDSIEVFGSPADATARAGYLSAFRPPFGDAYDHQNGAALLRLADTVTPAQAKALEAQFDAVTGR
jgi:hypothetical protein